MARRMLLYRGSLKSCNYSCSYCPFAKRRPSSAELSKDCEDWNRFAASFETQGKGCGAVMVVPYGEALIHAWYWEGFARLSRLDTLEAVGAQSNLSFDIEGCLHTYEKAGGKIEKLRLWATFHPKMVTVSHFADQCRLLMAAGVRFCAGAVGVPENLEILSRLRETLPSEVYLWINPMDGLKRRYTKAEEDGFTRIDPLFSGALRVRKAEPEQCRGRLFVEADGRMRQCNIGLSSAANWYDCSREEAVSCGRNICSCYLAYGGREDYEHRIQFGRWPLFRIPWSPKAVFLDLDGTIIPEVGGEESRAAEDPGSRDVISRISFSRTAVSTDDKWLDFLQKEARTKYLFLATSLPQKEAAAKCPEILPHISGGVYAAGAHVVFHGLDALCGIGYQPGMESQPDMESHHSTESHRSGEIFHTFDTPWLTRLTEFQAALGFRIRVYRQKGCVYKITLSRPGKRIWEPAETETVKNLLPSDTVRCFAENSRLQIVSREADKGSGVREMCAMLGIDPLATAAVGNSEEDIAMFRACGYGIAVNGCLESVAAAADFISKYCPADIKFHTP